MNYQYLIALVKENFLFWLSRKINYPLLPPDAVQVNFTFQCNLRCKMCSMHEQLEFMERRGRSTEIDTSTFMRIIDEAKEIGTNTILFIGGEPFLRKDLISLTSYAKSLKLNTVVVTNGVLLNEENIRKSMEGGVDWLSISIDAASEDSFRKIRGENVLSKIISNIEILNRLKKENKQEFPKTIAVCTIMDDNLEELIDIVNLCRRLGMEKIIFQPVVAHNIDQTKRDDIFPGFIPPERFKILDAMINKLIEYKKTSLQDFDFIANNIYNLKLIRKYFNGGLESWELPCYAGYNRLQIVQEGKIYFCIPQENEKELGFEAAFGDIRKSSLSDLWFSNDSVIRRKLIRNCNKPCLQWCSYRDRFIQFSDLFQKLFLFKKLKL